MSRLTNVLIAAKALIDTPEKWSQGSLYRDATGNISGGYREENQPVSCCSLGALIEATQDLDATVFGAAVVLLRREMGGGHIGTYNDEIGRTHEEVMAAWDRAIESSKA